MRCQGYCDKALWFATVTHLVILSAAHNCIHDTPDIQQIIKNDRLIVAQNYRNFKTAEETRAERHPIRIKFFFEDLKDPNQHCTAANQIRPDFLGEVVPCTPADVLTPTKRSYLVEKIIPAAVTKVQKMLSVARTSGNLTLPLGACGHFSIPTTHSKGGVSEADFVFYLASSAMRWSETMAWATACVFDQNGRPVVGRMNFAAKFIGWSSTDQFVNERLVNTAVHELLHALGFNRRLFSGKDVTTTSIRGKAASVFRHPDVFSEFRLQINCPSSIGPEIEDEGSSGAAGSHWDARLLKDDIMAATNGSVFSRVTLAALQATGWYAVNLSKGETHHWGKVAGCGFQTNKCNTREGGLGVWFCTENSDKHFCGIITYPDDLPSYFQYFSNPRKGGRVFLDKCPIFEGEIPVHSTSRNAVLIVVCTFAGCSVCVVLALLGRNLWKKTRRLEALGEQSSPTEQS